MTHVGNGKLQTPSHCFHLDNILRVPDLASNLLSVHKLCLQNNAFCYFDANQFLIVDLATGKVLYQGLSKDGVYPIPFPSQLILLLLHLLLSSLLLPLLFPMKQCCGIKDLIILAPSFFILPYLPSRIVLKFLYMMTFVLNVNLV